MPLPLTTGAERTVRASLRSARAGWALTLAMPLSVHCLWPWAYDRGVESVRELPWIWAWAEPRPVQWTVWFIAVFALAVFGLPHAVAVRWQERAPRLVAVVDPLRGVGYRSAPPRTWDAASVEAGVRWACRLFAVRSCWALASLNAFNVVVWWTFFVWERGPHGARSIPPPSDYLPFLAAVAVLTVACFPTRGRILRLLPAREPPPSAEAQR